MKKIFFILLVTITSCKKEDKKTCYECDSGFQPSGQYRDVGCYTDEEWKNFSLADPAGNNIDKNQRCRKH